ncbi:MAG: hypothetical protein A3J46_05315 [Candidatus Yanofskybacteria bacterium RIFCSPHIGHO2_02_FULL_41_11]|uniref:Methyltransferase type 11 domain-containing protein n=1 Tax=Candidatus Yanofskybacteria bacterium RIFCSPHIGHO2_02_FULL_41_11 TaxID=1802675 RepID=A0A1F8FEB9_9BACT|nr:MAG: hypothetical protein A3J46_05315 [Candidatus Yanofskybacteria bacterium RIFCSPHIGHO2_02_FULL_41_11]
MVDTRVQNEIEHGKFIAEKGEEIWNWSSSAGRLRWERRSRVFRNFIGNDSKKVLEVGCGTGLFTGQLALTNNQIVAIDISPALLDLAQKRTVFQNVIFKNEDAHRTSFEDQSFDFIVGISALHHLDIKLALKEFFRLLKPGGKIMFTEPNMLNPQIFIQKNIPFIKKLAGDSPDETAFIKWRLIRILTDFGFKDIIIKNFDFLHPAIPQFMISYATKVCLAMERLPILKEISGSLVIKASKLSI